MSPTSVQSEDGGGPILYVTDQDTDGNGVADYRLFDEDGCGDGREHPAAAPYPFDPEGISTLHETEYLRFDGNEPYPTYPLHPPVVYGPPVSGGDPLQAQTQTAHFGYLDPTYQPMDANNDPPSIPWAWPRLIRVTLSLADPNDPTYEQTYQFVFELPEEGAHIGVYSVLPALVTVVIAFLLRDVIVALFAGIVVGGAVTLRWNLLQAFILPAVGSASFAVVLVVYLWALGGLLGLWTRTGGAQAFAAWAGRKIVRGPRSARFFVWLVGLLFHQGGTISTILAGTTVRPVTAADCSRLSVVP